MLTDSRLLLEPIRRLHHQIRAEVIRTCESEALDAMAAIAKEEEGDTIYAVDRVSEELIIDFLDREIAVRVPIVVIAEGLEHGKVVLPLGSGEDEAVWRIIIDPIDGTRGLMYQKRSAWVLTGVARNRGPDTSLEDIELAVQTEIPLVKQHLSDSAWAFRSAGVTAERFNRLTGDRVPIKLEPSRSKSIAHGYAGIARFFPGAREVLAAIDEEIVRAVLGPVQRGKAHCFEDQYASSGGQLYELASGKDRFIADLRPLMDKSMSERGLALGICSHPYDLCTELIAREAGVIVTDVSGGPLRYRLDLEPECAWVGYANEAVRAQVEPALHAALHSRGLM